MKLHTIVAKITSVALVVALVIIMAPTNTAYAAALTAKSDTMSSSKKDALSSHVMKFTTPTGAGDSSDTIIITFPADFDFTSKTIGTVTFTHGASTGLESTETLAASPSASAWGAVFSGTENRILTLTAPSDGVGSAVVAASDKIIITYDSTNSVNPSTAASYAIAVTGTFGDTGNISVTILDDDQVAVTATVDNSISFAISDNTIEFGTLSSSAAQYADNAAGDASEVEAHTLIVGTNATNGYTMTLNGATLDAGGGDTIDSIGAVNDVPDVGTEEFGARYVATGGSGTVSAPYAAAGFAFDTASFPDAIASATGPSASTTYSARYVANIAAITEAGAYSSTLTYTATANF